MKVVTGKNIYRKELSVVFRWASKYVNAVLLLLVEEQSHNILAYVKHVSLYDK